MEVKGEIPWTKDIKIVIHSEKQFDVVNGGTRVYQMTDIFGSARAWFDAVERQLNLSKSFSP